MADAPGPEKDPFAHTRMSLSGHLEELRKRLWIGTLALAVSFSVALYFSTPPPDGGTIHSGNEV